MSFEDFKKTLSMSAPPAVAPSLIALWHDARGEWDKAHGVAQEVDDETGAWVHAYLHRKEGDRSNARYWYAHAGKPECRESLEQEWEQIAQELLKAAP